MAEQHAGQGGSEGRGESRTKPAAVWIVPLPGGAQTRVFGLTGAERVRRALRDRPVAGIHEDSYPPARPEGAPARRLVALRPDAIYDERLVHALLEAEPPLLVRAEGEPVAACVESREAERARAWLLGQKDPAIHGPVQIAAPDDLVPAYQHTVRKRQPAYALRVDAGSRLRCERFLFDAAYKGVTDLVTRWLWPEPAFWVTRGLARLGVAPNAVTAASWVLAGATAWLFATGSLASGLVLAWIMTFLDTVDGKLARVTLRSSRFGNLFDHVLDIVHPPVWYVAWALPLLEGSAAPWIPAAVAVILASYGVGRLLEAGFKLRFGFPIHLWEPIDSAFRLVTARRNPNLLLLSGSAALGRPELGLLAVAAWSVLSDLFHAVRFAIAETRHRRGVGLEAWLAREDAPKAEGSPSGRG